MVSGPGDMFGNAQAYDGYVGRWSRFVAHEFVAWLDRPSGLAWLDVGAGTGILTEVILERAFPARVMGVDTSADYVAVARRRIADGRVAFHVADATGVSGLSAPFDVAVSGLLLNFLPAPEAAMNSMVQAVRPGGMVAAYVWDYAGKMEMMRHFWDAAARLNPAAHALDAGQRFAICDPANLRSLFHAVNLTGVDVRPIDIATHFADFDDYWLPFLGAQGSVSAYLRGLDGSARDALRDELKRQLPTASDGSIALTARAWAVKGRRGGAE